MKTKKLVSTTMAGALIAAQMAMPAMAAASGSVTADLSTKTPMIRVQVPTKLAVAVDEFGTVGDGSQIYSEEFYIKNYSMVPVHVQTTSAVTTGTGVTLVATKGEVVEDENGDGNVWLAAVAKTAADKYGAASIGALTDAHINVATVDPTAGEAVQDFYLEKGSGAIEYKQLITEATVQDDVPSYAEFFELTAAASITDNDTLKTALASGDVYAIASADDAKDGATVTKVAEGATYSNTNKYYTAGTTAATLAGSKKYVYAGQATVGGEAGFRFIGKLSTGKSSDWADTDFSSISINYDITAVQAAEYATLKTDCTYGLYTEPTAPSISTAAQTHTLVGNTAVTIPVSLGAGYLGAKGVKSVMPKGVTNYDLIAKRLITYQDGVITIPGNVVTTMINNPDTYLSNGDNDGEGILVVTFNDSASTTVEITLQYTAPTN